MKNLKIFPKMFIQTFSILALLIILVHLLVFLVFPHTYLEVRKQEINSKADEISSKMRGKDIQYLEQALDFYSKNSEIKAFIKGKNRKNEIQIEKSSNINLKSDHNSLVIEDNDTFSFYSRYAKRCEGSQF